MPSPVSVLVRSRRACRRVDNDLVSPVKYGAAVPRGFTSASFTLARPLRILPADVDPYVTVTITDRATGEVLWDGWVEIPGRGNTRGAELYDVVAVGPAAHATDNPIPLGYVDSRLDQWERAGAAAGNVGQIIGGGNITVLQLHVPRGTVSTTGAYFLDAVYRNFTSAGQRLARLDYRWDSGITDAGWVIRAYAGIHLVRSDTANVAGSGGSSLVERIGSDWPADGTADAAMRWQRIGATGPVGDDVTWARFGTPLRVQATRYTAVGAELVTAAAYPNDYVLAHQVVNDVLGRPGMLPLYDGARAAVSTSSTVPITQLAYDQGAHAAQVFSDLMALDPSLFWAVWERQQSGLYRFEWSTWPTEPTLWAVTDGGYSSQPPTADLADRVLVKWRNTAGRIRWSTYTQDVPILTAAGRSRTKTVDLGGEVGSQEQADAAGAAELAMSRFPSNNGTLKMTRPIIDTLTGRAVPPWQVPRLAGRLIRLADVESRHDYLNPSDRDGTSVFRLTEATYDDAAREVTCTLDVDEASLVAALSRLRAQVAVVGRQ